MHVALQEVMLKSQSQTPKDDDIVTEKWKRHHRLYEKTKNNRNSGRACSIQVLHVLKKKTEISRLDRSKDNKTEKWYVYIYIKTLKEKQIFVQIQRSVKHSLKIMGVRTARTREVQINRKKGAEETPLGNGSNE